MGRHVACVMVVVFVALAACWPVGPARAEEYQPLKERIGGLRLGQPEAELAGQLRCAVVKSKEILEAASGEVVQNWRYADCGVVLKMSSARRGGKKRVAAITVTAPSTLKTAQGIGIGSTEQEVLKAYGRFQDQDGATRAGEQFVAGSIFDGLILTFGKGQVSEMFLGAAAE